ncbi:outer membrane protein assembly factor BamD [Tunturibacter empetritectus]|uniref:Outer membrane protein assembly factor BamD n=1 Tax=Tunturiibacter empetritectus TaxID=3069691 RepID=A0A7W8MS26_9BACT|nr:outer membrane protein assembly factor BamD [Edaphobacter lichenicola]MBB5318238.1 outer membrane protein assembly factor BamD [Edaphobacter lichenicola]
MNKRSFFPTLRAGTLAGVAIASLMFGSLSSIGALAQVNGSSQTTTDANGQQHESVTLSATPNNKKDKVVPSKDTKKELRKEKTMKPADKPNANLPDKVLYDKAVDATKRGHFDVARLDLQTLLNTYPDSQYQMKAKLAIGDSWYKEGGTAALTQAEQEYKDFITFFPNAPEAAEAQMRVGDIYFRQMDKPDRDYAKATHAEEEYRLMLQQFPESTLVPQAKQRLREVQEVMANREANIAAFYQTHNNYPATIARYQTVADTYPQYSHMDDVLVGLGDAYEAEARFVRTMKLPEAGKARLEKIYDDQAIAAYSKVILEHSASPHVEDARDRLDAMNVKIPQPTPEQIAASVALENSRRQYRLQDRARLLVLHQPDVVMAARDGEPTLADPTPTIAPHVVNQIKTDFNDALSPNAAAGAALTAKPATTTADAAPAAEGAAPAAPAAPLALSDVPAADPGAASGASSTTSISGAAPTPPASSGNRIGGVEILNSGTSGTTVPADGGLKAVGPTNSTPLPAVEKAAAAPDAVNDIKPGTQPVAQASNANGKNRKPDFDKGDESDSKHKKKKGLNKLNPF